MVENENESQIIPDQLDGASKSGEIEENACSKEMPTALPDVQLNSFRWVMLAIFSLNSMMNACLFISLGAINNIVSSYYGVSPLLIDWLSNAYFLIYTVLAIPAAFLMSYFGLRPILLISSFFNFFATCLRYAGKGPNDFTLVLVGQMFAALGYCTILQIPARLSSIWFGEHERNLASSIGAFMNIFGVSLGFIMSAQMVKESNDVKEIEQNFNDLFFTQMAMCFAFFALVVFIYEEKPPHPPSLSASAEEKQNLRTFLRSLKLLATDLHFNMMTQSYSIYFGLFNAFSVLLNQMVTNRFEHGYDVYIGWMGFTCDLVSIPSTIVLGILLDRYHQYRCQAITLNAMSLGITVVFMILITKTSLFYGVFAMYAIYGLFGVPYFCTGLEQAAVMTYPILESTSSAFILTVGNLYAFIMVLVLGKLATEGNIEIAGYTMVALYAISVILSACVKVTPRYSADLNNEDSDLSKSRLDHVESGASAKINEGFAE